MKADQQIVDEAAEWLVRLSTNSLTQNERLELEQWKKQSAEHLRIFEELSTFLNQVDRVKLEQFSSKHPVIQAHVLNQSPKKKTNWVRSGSALLIVFLAVCVILKLPIRQWRADESNQAGQWTTQHLSDQSQIQMSGQTAYNLTFNPQQRKLHLLEGNILVSVAKDTSRPFIVDLGDVKVQALGTKFIVNYHHNQVQVSMLESTTRISSAQNRFKEIILTQGQSFYFDGQQVQVKANEPSILQKSWQNKKLLLNDVPLDQALDLLQSYQSTQYMYSRKSLSAYRVNAVLSLEQPETALELLKQEFDLETYSVAGLFTFIQKNTNKP